MQAIIISFILLGSAGGYIEPLTIQAADLPCGLEGAVVGIQVDRLVNPTFVTFPDPNVAGKHCQVSIEARVAGLIHGVYEIATTEVGKVFAYGPGATQAPGYIGVDPHVTGEWMRDAAVTTAPAIAPTGFRWSPK